VALEMHESSIIEDFMFLWIWNVAVVRRDTLYDSANLHRARPPLSEPMSLQRSKAANKQLGCHMRGGPWVIGNYLCGKLQYGSIIHVRSPKC